MDRLAVKQYFPVSWCKKSRHSAQQGRFPAGICSNDCCYLAGRHLKIETIQHKPVTIASGQLTRDEGVIGHRDAPLRLTRMMR